MPRYYAGLARLTIPEGGSDDPSFVAVRRTNGQESGLAPRRSSELEARGQPSLARSVHEEESRYPPPGLELTVERLGEADFTFLASYVLSRSYGNYTGLFASDVPAGGANISPQTISPRSS